MQKTTQHFLILFILIASIPLFLFEYGEVVQKTNQTYTDNSVLFFRGINLLGDAVLYAPIAFICLIISFRKTILLILFLLLQTLFVRVFKDWLTEGMARPFKFFQQQGTDLQIGELVDIHMVDTFPSGHATTAFSLAFFLMINAKKSNWQIIIFSLFAIGAFARVYLAQHFYIDVFAGLLFGLSTAMISKWLYDTLKIDNVKGSLLQLLTSKNS